MIKLKLLLIESLWRGWDDILPYQKKKLAMYIQKWIDHLNKFYSPKIANQIVFISNKIIKGLDESDPTMAGKALSKLSMESRMDLGGFIDNFNDVDASKVFNILHDIALTNIEPIKVDKPDFVLKGWASIQKQGTDKVYFHDVFVKGLEDLDPKISFDNGYYTLDKDFYNKYSTSGTVLAWDLGKDIYVINMPEIMDAVKKELDKRNYKL